MSYHVLSLRPEFSEESTWRSALGDSAPLLVCADWGPIDAPQFLPAGSMIGRFSMFDGYRQIVRPALFQR